MSIPRVTEMLEKTIDSTSFLLKSGAKIFDISKEIIRPADVNAYAIGDLINTATDATVLPSLDFTTYGAVANQKIQIHSISIISSNGAVATKLLPWVSLYNADALTGQNLGDNQAFNPIYAEIVAKRGKSFRDDEFYVVGLGTNAYIATLNELCRNIKLDSAGKLYIALRAQNAYVPASGEKFTINVTGFLL